MKFLDIFNPIEKGNYALTDEAIYASINNSIDMIPLWGGNKEHETITRMVSRNAKTKKDVPITVFSGEGIIISLDGSAGCMTYKNNQDFALNHHAGFITMKKDSSIEINLEFFAKFFQNYFRSLSVSDGSKTLSLDQLYSEDINIPSITLQNKIMKEYNILNIKIEQLNEIENRLYNLLNKEISPEYGQYQTKNEKISNLIDSMGGNQGLTEEFIYQNLQNKNEQYMVLSSAIDDKTMMGLIPMCRLNGNNIKVFKDKEGLLVTRNGKAGQTKFLPKGNYTINDHGYILYKKNNCKYDINLQWLAIQYKKEFLSYTSNSDNGTWNKTGFFNSVKIDLPIIKEQENLVDIYNKLLKYLDNIKKIKQQFDIVISREIIENIS